VSLSRVIESNTGKRPNTTGFEHVSFVPFYCVYVWGFTQVKSYRENLCRLQLFEISPRFPMSETSPLSAKNIDGESSTSTKARCCEISTKSPSIFQPSLRTYHCTKQHVANLNNYSLVSTGLMFLFFRFFFIQFYHLIWISTSPFTIFFVQFHHLIWIWINVILCSTIPSIFFVYSDIVALYCNLKIYSIREL
jgi:hypothetical protein